MSQKAAVQNVWRCSRRPRGWRRDARQPARRTAASTGDARHQVEERVQRSAAAGTRSFGPCHPGSGIFVSGLADPEGGSASSRTGQARHPRRERGGRRGCVWAAVEPPNSNRVLGARDGTASAAHTRDTSCAKWETRRRVSVAATGPRNQEHVMPCCAQNPCCYAPLHGASQSAELVPATARVTRTRTLSLALWAEGIWPGQGATAQPMHPLGERRLGRARPGERGHHG